MLMVADRAIRKFACHEHKKFALFENLNFKQKRVKFYCPMGNLSQCHL